MNIYQLDNISYPSVNSSLCCTFWRKHCNPKTNGSKLIIWQTLCNFFLEHPASTFTAAEPTEPTELSTEHQEKHWNKTDHTLLNYINSKLHTRRRVLHASAHTDVSSRFYSTVTLNFNLLTPESEAIISVQKCINPVSLIEMCFKIVYLVYLEAETSRLLAILTEAEIWKLITN